MHNVVNRQRMMLDIMIYVYLFVCSHFFRNLNKQNKGVYSFPELNFPLAYVVFIECFFLSTIDTDCDTNNNLFINS